MTHRAAAPRWPCLSLMLFLALALIPHAVWAQEGGEAEEPNPLESLDWKNGPTEGTLSSIAYIKVPEGFRFLEANDAQQLLRMCGNMTDGNEYGIVAPDEGLDWFVVFSWEDCGYVKDDEEIDADDLYEALDAGQKKANEQLRSRGLPELHLVGWAARPQYNRSAQRLEWGLKLKAEGEELINFNTRLLGRKGVMSANLVVDPEDFTDVRSVFDSLLRDYGFQSGQNYAEYRKGDKIAQYGLAALVTGGALAVAAKTGLLARFWKFLIFIPVAIAAFWRKITGKASRPTQQVRRRGSGPPPPPAE